MIYIYAKKIYPYVNGYNHYYNQQPTINDQSLRVIIKSPMVDDSLKNNLSIEHILEHKSDYIYTIYSTSIRI